MNKKITATIMLSIFMSVSFSCNYYTKKVYLEEGKKPKLENAKVLNVYTKSRQLIIFLKKTPAVVTKGNIVGLSQDKMGQTKLISIPLSEAKVLWLKKKDAIGTFFNIFGSLGALFLLGLSSNR